MYKCVIVFLCVMISACSPNITGGEVKRAVALCEDKGGVELLHTPTFFAIVDLSRMYSVKCNNNQTLNINKGQ